jgi:hypothetical protein
MESYEYIPEHIQKKVNTQNFGLHSSREWYSVATGIVRTEVAKLKFTVSK